MKNPAAVSLGRVGGKATSAPALLAALARIMGRAQYHAEGEEKQTLAAIQREARAAIAAVRGESLAAKFEAGWQKSIAAGSVRRGQS
jgi:hypothetical protein